ncbi:hypothetical protein [Bacillus sp. FSL K6-3431]|uniref:hypothetical protein n=1 Tax=Bacillus sp. FSL K6-3431 TaxID=2921500 RepID=UPI0030F4D40F
MRGVRKKFYVNEENVVEKVKVERYIGQEKISEFTFRVGSTLGIQPLNKRATRNRGRSVQILGFNRKDEKDPMRAKVKYLDTNRNGFVEIDDLDVLE